MRKHAPSALLSLKNDRQSGRSIHELMEKYSLPKSTVWHHVHEVKLSQEQKKLLRSRMGAGAKRSQQKWSAAETQAKNIPADFSEAMIWPVLIAALYWSEGTKKGGFVFTNTDESMIRVFLKILREKLKVQDKDLDVLIRTSTPMNPLACRRYWSEVTGMSMKAVRINHDDKHNKGKTIHGMCRLTVRKGGYHLKLMHCLIRELTAKMLESSRSSTDRTSHS